MEEKEERLNQYEKERSRLREEKHEFVSPEWYMNNSKLNVLNYKIEIERELNAGGPELDTLRKRYESAINKPNNGTIEANRALEDVLKALQKEIIIKQIKTIQNNMLLFLAPNSNAIDTDFEQRKSLVKREFILFNNQNFSDPLFKLNELRQEETRIRKDASNSATNFNERKAALQQAVQQPNPVQTSHANLDQNASNQNKQSIFQGFKDKAASVINNIRKNDLSDQEVFFTPNGNNSPSKK